MSFAVTLHDSNVSDFKFFSVFRCRSPPLVMREFDTFKDTNPISPVHFSWKDNDISMQLKPDKASTYS